MRTLLPISLCLVFLTTFTQAQDAAKWEAVKLKTVPQSYGSLTGNNSITVQGKFEDSAKTYTVVEEKESFVKVSDGKSSGWVFKVSVTRVEAPNPVAPTEPDWVAKGQSSPVVRDPLIGTKVFWKDSAVAKIGNEVIDKYKFLAWPALVEDIDGDWLWLSRAWVRRSDVMQLDEAFEYYFEEVRRKPTSAWAWNCRAACWRLKGELNNAIKDYDEAIRLDPKDATAYNNRGIAKDDLKDYSGAIGDYDEAIRLDPKDATAYINRGWAKSNLKDFAGAIADYDEAIRLDPKDAMAYNNRGGSKMLSSDWKGAIDDWDEAIRLDPKQSYPINNKSFLLSTCPEASIRDANMAAELAERALKLDPKNAYAMNARACAYAAAGDFKKAIEWQKQAIENEDFMKDDGVEGGQKARERIAKWEAEELWLMP